MQTFLAWLAARVELKDGDQQPEPRVLDEDAIVLTTWHSAKGREWPVVAVCGLDKEVKAKLPDLGLGYASFEDLSKLLEVARIEYAPKFAAPETDDELPRRAASRWRETRGAAAAVRGAHARARQAGARVAGVPRRQAR